MKTNTTIDKIYFNSFYDELQNIEKNAGFAKVLGTGALIWGGLVGPVATPQIIAMKQNEPIMRSFVNTMQSGTVNARNIINKYDPGTIPLTSKSQLDTAQIDKASKAIAGSQINKSNKFTNTFFVPGIKGNRYIVSPELTDSAIIGHELGHSKHYQQLSKNKDLKTGLKLFKKYPTVNREIMANQMAPIKSSNYNKIMNPAFKTYKNINTANKFTKGIAGSEFSLGLIALGKMLIKRRKFK
jgi:hypothetical protein